MTLPEIQTRGRALRDLTADALASLEAANDPPCMFVRGDALARVRRDEHDRPLVEQLGEHGLRGALDRVADWTRASRDGDTPVPPPIEVVRDVLALPGWPFPPLEGITETPALRPDGSLILEPGYDTSSRLVYAPTPGLTLPAIPEQPTGEQLAAAVAVLAEALEGFPFDDEPSRANAIALSLTPVLRPAIEGQVPLALVDATKAGTGKGLLVNLVAVIATGKPAAMLPAPRREEEWGKTILALLLRGATFIALDEAAELRSAALAAALTADVYEDRILGRSETVQLPQRATWAATGNNIQLRGDLARRCYWIRLDAKTARPWQREGFLHPDLLGWARADRGRLLAALLTIARAWYSAGRPGVTTPPLGGFEPWARTLAGILAHAGIPGFLGNLDELYDQADQDAGAWEAFLAAWHDHHANQAIPAARLLDAIRDGGPLRDTLPEDLAIALDKSVATFRAKLGKALAKRAGTRYGEHGLRVERAAKDHSGVQDWRVLSDHEPNPQRSQRSQRSISHASAAPRAHAREERQPTSATSAPLRPTLGGRA